MIGKLLLLFTISFALTPNAHVSQVLDNLDQEVTRPKHISKSG